MQKFASILIPCLLLAACAATPFQPVNANGYGYAEQQVSIDVYTVVFVGNTATPMQQVKDYTLLRAAEIGAAQGFAYLTVEQDKSGNIMISPRAGSGGADMLDASQDEQSSRGAGMMGMSGNAAGSYGGNGASYSVGGGSSGNPARACALMLHFSKQPDTGAGKQSQDIQALITKLRAQYSLPAGSN